MKYPTSLFPKEQWWIAAYSGEIDRSLFGRTLLNQRVVLYRKEDGQAVAVGGYCPHRNFPIEDSILKGDSVVCGYHGFEFSCTGKCTHIPSQEMIPDKASLPNYPVEERGGLIWIWMGDSAKADPALIPDVASLGLEGDDWKAEASPAAELKGRYSLLIDNLLDLTHVAFIHSDTIPAGENLVAIPSEIITSDKSINVQRIGRHIPSNPYFQMLFPEYDGPIDAHFDTEYLGPCIIRTGGKHLKAGTEQELGTVNFIHGITPETSSSTHYFVLAARNFATDVDQVGETHLRMGDAIQPQDIGAIEAIEAGYAKSFEMPPAISVKADAGGNLVRRMLDKQISKE